MLDSVNIMYVDLLLCILVEKSIKMIKLFV